MKVEQKGHTSILKDTESSLDQFIEKVVSQYTTFKKFNLILDVTHNKNMTINLLKEFIELTKLHKKNNKSLVIVAPEIDYNKIPTSLQVVPSVLEAHDIIEMEEIERDLGF